MFYIKSYIKYPTRNIYNLEDIQKNPSYFFIDINDVSDMASIKNLIDVNYIEGAIVIKYDEKSIFNLAMYDLVDQLWTYLIRMIEDVLETGYAETYFPDQPIKLEMQKISEGYVQLCVITQEKMMFSFNFKELANTLLVGGKQFFTSITKSFHLPDNYYHAELQKIDELTKKLNVL